MAKTKLEKIDGIKDVIEQLKKRQRLLLQQHNAQERKDRNHRLCRRGGIVEKLLPDLITLTDEQFDTFVEKTLLSGHAERILKGLTGQERERVLSIPAEPVTVFFVKQKSQKKSPLFPFFILGNSLFSAGMKYQAPLRPPLFSIPD